MDVVIVGGGLEGMAAAWALAERGMRDVLVLERGTVGPGATGMSSGVVHCRYGTPSSAAMAWRSLQIFEKAEEILGASVGFRRTGHLVGVGPLDVRALEAGVAMQRALGIDVYLVGRDDAARLRPAAELKDFAAFAYEPRGGYGDAHRTAHAFGRAAMRAGARIRQHAPVAALTASRDRVTGVRLADGQEIAAGTVVVAAGPWSPALVAPLGVDLPDASFASLYAGCHDATPGFAPVIGPAGPEGLFVAAGFGGHGYATSPAVGTLIADLLCEGASTDPDVPAADFALRRFAHGRPPSPRQAFAGTAIPFRARSTAPRRILL
ncbi:NAD(P)/FAD-dependent oxidoreductase [Yinghuangia soli]|uniref:FAD-binding oxidoreductase n=1 Tax=Yinghuangia soli TaxID=2908204 RepID=A0AA41PZT0_9ACTN|nr:FAD-dependent oxidoreductase [Yinghuangia soli]MCF2527814.1 FAD-binding oxidoreductase [Yinghuangia soli]